MEQIRTLAHRQLTTSVDFRTLAAESAWNPEPLFDIFRHRLSEVVKDELAAQELLVDLDSLTALTIRIEWTSTGTQN